MYSFWHELLSDKKGGEIFTLFSGWHFFYIAMTLATVVVLILLLKNNVDQRKVAAPRMLIALAFGLYIADFFLMPLAYEQIDIEKLPFHACTAMCVMCFLSYRCKFLAKYRVSLVCLGLISNLVYLIYPAGVMWHAVHPLSYRVIQTLLFHSVMTVYGVLALAYEPKETVAPKGYRDLVVIICMTLWAMLGNYTYNGTAEGYDHFFNWFFVVRDPFNAINASIAPYVMPLLNVLLFYTAMSALRFAVAACKKAART